MRSLPVKMPEVQKAFENGEFSVQMSDKNPFGRNEADKTIENTLEKNKFLPKFVNILEKLWKTEFSLNITNIVIFYFLEYSNIRSI